MTTIIGNKNLFIWPLCLSSKKKNVLEKPPTMALKTNPAANYTTLNYHNKLLGNILDSYKIFFTKRGCQAFDNFLWFILVTKEFIKNWEFYDFSS